MLTLWQDIRFAARLLIKDRSFTVTAVLTLALCVAANTAMFGVVRSVLLKPLPFPGSDQIVLLYNSYPNAGAPRAGASVPDLYDRLAAVPALAEQGLFRPEGMTFGDENGVERLTSLRATPSFYRLLGVAPAAGRLFTDTEGERGKALKVILSHAFWHRKFAGRESIVGQAIRMNGNSFDVVGVMPAGFSFLQAEVDVYVPLPIGPMDRGDDRRHSGTVQMVGRLASNASVALVQQQVDALNARNDDRFPQYRQLLKDAQFRTVAVRLQDDVVRDVRSVLYLLLGGVLFVLLIGCVNIGNLVLIRTSGRRREMATRHAIGAGRGRLARQLFTEMGLLASVGGALGLLAGWWTLRLVAALDLDGLPRGSEIGLDASSMVAALAVIALVAVGLGAAPVVSLRHLESGQELREDSRGGAGSRRARVTRQVLATSQVAVAFVLLAGAGLLFASFQAVLRVDLGFQPQQVMTAAVHLPATAYRDDASLVAFQRSALQAIRALPAVESAGLTSAVPFSGGSGGTVMFPEGYVVKPGESVLAPNQVVVSPGYFETMRIRLVRGRGFDDRDGPDGTAVSVVVDERLAQRFWPDQDPIGRRVYLPSDPVNIIQVTKDTPFFTVVGLAQAVQATDPRLDAASVGTCYFSSEQAPTRPLTLVVRTRGANTVILPEVRREIARIDPELPVFRPRPMQAWIDRALASRRLPVLIGSAFAVLALGLASIGIYGVLAHGVSERRREIGVRLALGSTTSGVFRLILREGLTIVLGGLALGLAGAIGVGRLLQTQLFGVSSLDPVVMVAVTLTLAVCALLATLIPSWRASSVAPATVLSK
jgi:predicted permease